MKSFEGKTAVVTGAAEGIGQSLVVALADLGVNIAFCDINDRTETEHLLAKKNIRVLSKHVDMSDLDQISSFVEDVKQEFGDVHLLFNNAGIALGDRTFSELSLEDFERITNVNYWGVIRTTKLLYPVMVKQDEAAVINLSSSQGLLPFPYLIPYCTTKFAVRGFTDTLRTEHAIRGLKNITFHTVHPGAVATNITLNSDYHGTNTPHFHDMLQRIGATPDKAAKIIIQGVRKKKGRIFISDGRIQDWLIRILPNTFPYILRVAMKVRRTEVR
ncbi:SDR family NAD(P)-dependent oxidoreductase [Veronia pacifica]|uniref:Short-chain dehydrogenase n=1 Tax=Veronia pacifica TaxID=1080227 RepID=A0A1C3ERR3_9GAMM|nr:SDR family oxidoreductase [Veronia pacifica]ODA35914.1 short-chain dehydrogenase [Veronia pacifica]